MSSADQDIVDKIFSTGYSLYSKGNRVISDVSDRVINKVRHAQWDSKADHLENIEQSSNLESGLHSIKGFFPWLYGQRKKALFGMGLTAGAVVLYWQCSQLLSIPQRLPQSQARCVLILGDMRDPIVRSQVMDLYRRRFLVFICSTNAKVYRERQEDDEFLRHIDPNSASDLTAFIEFLKRPKDTPCKLASILFMPNLAYYPSGDLSSSQLESEIQSNVLVYYKVLVSLLVHLDQGSNQLILFNPSLSFNLAIPHHPAEIFISGLMSAVHQSLKSHNRLSVYTVHLGALKLAAQPSNYKYLSLRGSNINDALLKPVYSLIMTHDGNWVQNVWQWVKTFGSLQRNLYCGQFSLLSRISLLAPFIGCQSFNPFKNILK